MKNISVGIIDYGFGNISSLHSCLMSLGFKVRVSNKRSILKKTNILFLPGVGSFDAGMQSLNEQDLSEFIKLYSDSGKSIVGICLGMQLLFGASKEGKPIKGLSLIPGNIVPVKSISTHIGWNTISNIKIRSPFKEFDKDHFYFNHSFGFEGSDRFVLAKAKISRRESVAAIVKKNNILGIQFHPEKSQTTGSNLLRKFIINNYNA